jgi:hypothetical protein
MKTKTKTKRHISPEERIARRWVRAFDTAAQNYAFKGGAHPDEWDAIEYDYQESKKQLYRAIAKLGG